MLQINDPETLAEVSEAFRRYEAALVANDVAVLNALFWNAEPTLRYGLAENLYGHDAISRFRQARRPAGIARRLSNTVITTYGRDFATANTEFERTASGRRGRQSQTWVRFSDGWRIVAAHVSFFDPDAERR